MHLLKGLSQTASSLSCAGQCDHAGVCALAHLSKVRSFIIRVCALVGMSPAWPLHGNHKCWLKRHPTHAGCTPSEPTRFSQLDGSQSK